MTKNEERAIHEDEDKHNAEEREHVHIEQVKRAAFYGDTAGE